MANIQAIIFDLYNTLIYPAYRTKPHAQLFADLGLQTPEEFKWARRIATTENFNCLTDLMERIKPGTQLDSVPYELEIEREIASVSLFPETKEALGELQKRNFRLGLISNLVTPYKKPFFDLGLERYFQEIVFSSDVGFRKPEPEIYQKMMERLNIIPAQALMIGDNLEADVEGPKSIGMKAVLLDRGNNSSGSISPSDSISSLQEIFPYLMQLHLTESAIEIVMSSISSKE